MSEPPGQVVFPADWCSRAGAREGDRTDLFFAIAVEYWTAQESECSTVGLTESLPDTQFTSWLNYLFGYTNAMVGCPFSFEPVPGGILAFGPANTPAIGLARPALGRDDAGRLIELYLANFALSLGLSEEESDAVEAHLWRTAEPEIDPAASRTLSQCPAGVDASP